MPINCTKEKAKEYAIRYYNKNKEKIQIYQSMYREQNRAFKKLNALERQKYFEEKYKNQKKIPL